MGTSLQLSKEAHFTLPELLYSRNISREEHFARDSSYSCTARVIFIEAIYTKGGVGSGSCILRV